MNCPGEMRARTTARRRGNAGQVSTGLLVIGLLATVGLAGWWLSGSDGDGGGVDEARVVGVERRDLIDGVNANGRVEPLARVAVMSRAGGIIEHLLVDEGDVVRVGQVLAELDREQLQAQLAQDQADLASAEARLAQTEARLVEQRLRLEDPELEFAQREFARLDLLHQSGDVSERERDDAALALEQVRFRLAQVEHNLPVMQATVAEARADLAASQAALERSETAWREATIRCPIDGVVLTRDREVGDGVSSILTAGGNATQIFTLGDLSEMYVEARVDEVDLGRIRVGMPAVVTVDAHRGRELSGAVDRIAPAGSVDGNGIVTFEVRLTVDDPEGLLKPDMTADAKLVLARRDGVLTLPQRALRRVDSGGAPRGSTYGGSPGAAASARDEGGWYVERVVMEADVARLQRTQVTLGLSDGLMTEVASGLSEDDRVLLPDTLVGGGRRP